MENFRAFVKELDGDQSNPNWDDHYLLRFLRARKFNKAETEKMWKDFINWRIQNNVDNAFVNAGIYFRNFTCPRSSSFENATPMATIKPISKADPFILKESVSLAHRKFSHLQPKTGFWSIIKLLMKPYSQLSSTLALSLERRQQDKTEGFLRL